MNKTIANNPIQTMEAKILVVEDSKTQLLHLKSIIENHGYEVQTAENGKDALRVLEFFHPNLILSDIIMPEMNGYELCKIIKDEEKWHHIPIILLTALSNPNDIITGLNAGADNFIPKPFTDNFLLSKINQLIANDEMRSESVSDEDVEILFAGKRHTITAGRIQIIDLLLSTYESAVNKNDELHKANLELSQLKEELEKNNLELEKANEEKNHFIGMAAHDIRNPLGSILGFADLLKDEFGQTLNNDQIKFIDFIKSSANLLLNMVTELLDISKIEAGELTLKKESINLIDFLESNIAKNKYLADRKNIAIKVNYGNTENTEVKFDSFRLEQVFNNLISNAIKYSASQTTILISIDTNDNQIKFSIKDQGVGISEKELVKLFKPFSKTSAQTTAGESSTGLGLFTCKKIIEVHGGTINVESIEGEGSTFYFNLPIEKAQIETIKKDIKSEKSDPLTGKKILLVDDLDVNYAYFKGALKKLKMSLDWANNGLKAIEMCKNQDYDLILMDIHMPEMNGLDVTRQIRQFNNEVTIIGQTAYVMEGMEEKCRQAGCNNYIGMPIRPKQVIEIITNSLK